MPAITGQQILPEADPENLPPATLFTQQARERFLYGGRSETTGKEDSREEEADDQPEPVVKSEEVVTVTHSARKRVINDPFEELFKLIREQGKGEQVELRVGGISLKFNTLAVQYSLPLVTLMVDSKALGLDMDTDSDVQLKLRGRQYDAKYVVTMPCSGHVNLMFFLVKETNESTTGSQQS